MNLANLMTLEKYYNYDISKRSLKYRLYYPKGNKIKRIVVFLHGAGERGSDGLKHILKNVDIIKDIINHPNYGLNSIIIAPQAPLRLRWVTNLSYKFNLLIEDFLINGINKLYGENKIPIHLIGLSMGAIAINKYVNKYPGFFKSIISICGTIDLNKLDDLKKTPGWYFHSLDDSVVSPLSYIKASEILKRKAPSIKFTFYEDANHASWERAYLEEGLIDWLFKY